jgi:hypothetical protein
VLERNPLPVGGCLELRVYATNADANAARQVAAGIGLDLPVIFVSFASPDGTDPLTTKATINGCVWHRARSTRRRKLFLSGWRLRRGRSGRAAWWVGFLA